MSHFSLLKSKDKVKLRLGLLEVKVLLSLGFWWRTFALLILSMDKVSMAFFVLDLGAAHLGCLD